MHCRVCIYIYISLHEIQPRKRITTIVRKTNKITDVKLYTSFPLDLLSACSCYKRRELFSYFEAELSKYLICRTNMKNVRFHLDFPRAIAERLTNQPRASVSLLEGRGCVMRYLSLILITALFSYLLQLESVKLYKIGSCREGKG